MSSAETSATSGPSTTPAPPAASAAAHVPATTAQPALVADGITVRFGGLTALDGVDLTVPAGQVVGVIGPNGAGKTTLFNVVCGFVRPSEGSLRLYGRALRRHHPHQLARLGIARTLQGLGLFPHLTVLDNVLVGATRHARAGFAAALFGLPRSDRDERALRDRAMTALTDLGAAADAQRLPGELPYGVQKRVALARALVTEPRLLLLDEPASGLSDVEIDELREIVTTRLRGDLAVLLVEHHMDFVTTVSDRIVVLDFGRVIATGPPEQIRSDPRVAEAYLGEDVHDTGGPAGDTPGNDGSSGSGGEAGGRA